jgi:PST family polysaccharide transporter
LALGAVSSRDLEHKISRPTRWGGLLGSQWREVVPVLQVLSLVAVLQSIVFPAGWIFTALGKTKEQFQLRVLGLIFVPPVGIGI